MKRVQRELHRFGIISAVTTLLVSVAVGAVMMMESDTDYSSVTTRKLSPIVTVDCETGEDLYPNAVPYAAAPYGTPMTAADDGVITYAGWQDAYGKVVRIRHKNSYETVYAHMARIPITSGGRTPNVRWSTASLLPSMTSRHIRRTTESAMSEAKPY
jgi:Peptidase family M23